MFPSVISSAARPLPLCAPFAQRNLSGSFSSLAIQHSPFGVNRVAGDGHGGLQQSLPARNAAPSRHNKIVTEHEFGRNRRPSRNPAGIGGAQSRRNRVVPFASKIAR